MFKGALLRHAILKQDQAAAAEVSNACPDIS